MSHLAKVAQDCRDNGTTAEGFYFGFQFFWEKGESLTSAYTYHSWGYYPLMIHKGGYEVNGYNDPNCMFQYQDVPRDTVAIATPNV